MEQTKAPRIGLPWSTRIFGTYDRRADLDRLQSSPSRWTRPVSGLKAWTTILVTLITVCGAVVTKRIETPQTSAAVIHDSMESRDRVQLAGQVVANTKAIVDLRRQVDAIEPLVQTNLYINCELLRRSQPGAIPPRECSDEAQRARRVVP